LSSELLCNKYFSNFSLHSLNLYWGNVFRKLSMQICLQQRWECR